MSSYNKVILMGNVTRDVVVKTLPNGTKLVELGLAVNRNYTQDGEKKEEVTFVDVTFFGKQAETIGQYVSKGNPILVEGRLKLETWTDKDNGGSRQKLKVMGEGFQFLNSKEKFEPETDSVKKTTKIVKKTPDDGLEPASFNDDEIPF